MLTKFVFDCSQVLDLRILAYEFQEKESRLWDCELYCIIRKSKWS
jgi:hypothetical protein